MIWLSRRQLLRTGLGFSLAPMLGHSEFPGPNGSEQSMLAATNVQPAAATPRERLLFDFGWAFRFGHLSDPARDLGLGKDQSDFAKTGAFAFAKAEFDDGHWSSIDLPHDWAVELPFVHDDSLASHGFKPLGRCYPETSVGWYRRVFAIPAKDKGRRITVEFGGAFRSVLVFVNGCLVGRNDDGYVPFEMDLSDFLVYGGSNCIVVRCDASQGEGWFYEGAGIYRHVWLEKSNPVHLVKDESIVLAQVDGEQARLELRSSVRNESSESALVQARWIIEDALGAVVARAACSAKIVAPGQDVDFLSSASIAPSRLWSLDDPHLYVMQVEILKETETLDAERVSFGIRTAHFDADKGFFLNGRPLKIQGTCSHQDHAGVGAALPDDLYAYRLRILKSMGCNAVRTAHNMPAQEWVSCCDRMGIMMVCETRQMSSSQEGLAGLASMIKRYRNSPSIVLWSIGNEEWFLQGSSPELGEQIGARMVRLAHQLDPTRSVTAAVNDSNEKGLSKALDVIGFNYNRQYPDEFHRRHPRLPVFGSETASAVATRGVYFTDPLCNTVSAYDVNHSEGGELAEEWWPFYVQRPWAAGGFAWTGFDYRGEPTPYGWPSISSQFGIVDLCGFPKDSYYYYQSCWGGKPILHLFPHWNFAGKEDLAIPVWVYTNVEEVELLLNGNSLGRKLVSPLGHLSWDVPYRPGVIEARGYVAGKFSLSARRETTGPATEIRLVSHRNFVVANGEDLAILKASAVDEHGREVPTADHRVVLKITGPGRIIGVGNGNPNCQDAEKADNCALFNGLAQFLIQATKQTGKIEILAEHQRWGGALLMPCSLTIHSQAGFVRPCV